MKRILRQVLWTIHGYVIAWTVGNIFGIVFAFLVALGAIRIRGYWYALREVWRGRVIIAANHPSMLEPFLIGLMFYPWYLFFPWRFFVWSMPDRKLLSRTLHWLFPLGRCITVDRSKPASHKRSLRLIHTILEEDGVLVIHPEQGRTFRESNWIVRGNRRIRRFVSGAPALARKTRARIMTLWVEGADKVLRPREWFPQFWRGRIDMSFGPAYEPPKADKIDASEDLAERIIKS